MSQPNVTDTQEDYLETILVLETESGVARLTSIAHRLGLSKSTVSTTLQSLRKRGLVVYEPYKLIALTPTGVRIARQVLCRHQALREFLVDVLLLEEDLADETACKMEHGISKQALDRIVAFTEFVEGCPYSNKGWLKGFGFYCKNGSLEQCEHCEKTTKEVRAGTGDRKSSQRVKKS